MPRGPCDFHPDIGGSGHQQRHKKRDRDKGGSHFETAGLVTTVAFDKTGTLTLGHPEVTSVVSLSDEFDEKDILRLAALAEQFSEHHKR